MHETTEAFAELARSYCAWAEHPPAGHPSAEVVVALDHLLRLSVAALHLPQGEGSEEEVESNSHEEWRRIYDRFRSLPIDFYYKVFDPLVELDDELVGGTLADDLADIHRDLQRGLVLYDRGDMEGAAWEWGFHFRAHWGKHATAAIYALQSWWADNYFDEVEVNSSDGSRSV